MIVPLLAASALYTAIAVPAPRPGWFVCDGIDRPVAWLVGSPDARRQSAITWLDKRTGRTTTTRYQVGRADPGAGNIYHGLSRGGREVGNLRQINAGMTADPARATTLPFTAVTLDGGNTECRWLQDTHAAGVTARRGVTVTREGGRLVYRTFDFTRPTPIVRPDGAQRSNRPSLEIAGGTERRASDGRIDYRFANRGWTYSVSARGDGRDGMLTVMRDGRIVQRERFLGLTLAP